MGKPDKRTTSSVVINYGADFTRLFWSGRHTRETSECLANFTKATTSSPTSRESSEPAQADVPPGVLHAGQPVHVRAPAGFDVFAMYQSLRVTRSSPRSCCEPTRPRTGRATDTGRASSTGERTILVANRHAPSWCDLGDGGRGYVEK